MKANLKTGFIWASHALLLVGLPLIWLYSFFINKEVFYTIGTIIDSVQQPMDYLWGFPIGMALIIFTFYPLAYVFILFAYSVFETNVFKFLSFHYVQNNGLLRNKQYLYDTTFSVLERVLDEKNYEQHPLFYDFTYQTRPEKVAFTFHEKTQDKTWQLVMGESYFYLKTLSKVEHASEFVTPKVHDQKIYQMYYETLLAYVKNKEKQSELRENLKKEQQERKEKQIKNRLLYYLFKEINQMKKEQISEKKFILNLDFYHIVCDKRTIVIEKNAEVYVKCMWIKEKPVVYLKNGVYKPKKVAELTSLYEQYATKEKSVH